MQEIADLFSPSIGRLPSTGPNALRPHSSSDRTRWIDSRGNWRKNPGPIEMLGMSRIRPLSDISSQIGTGEVLSTEIEEFFMA
jgi:hypothetical protein